jgi:hypothetical protein
MIWRTVALGQFESAHVPGRAGRRRFASMLRQTQGAFASVGHSVLFYPSGGHKPMALLLF